MPLDPSKCPPLSLSRYSSPQEPQRRRSRRTPKPLVPRPGSGRLGRSRSPPQEVDPPASASEEDLRPRIWATMSSASASQASEASSASSTEEDEDQPPQASVSSADLHPGYGRSTRCDYASFTYPPASKQNSGPAGSRQQATEPDQQQCPAQQLHPTGPQQTGRLITTDGARLREVLLQCGNSATFATVTPATTAIQLLHSAKTKWQHINVDSAILLEHFGPIGVERALRQYELVCNVLNSWDADRQNKLIIVEPGQGGVETELRLSGVPSELPNEQHWILHHSTTPGKWYKRTVSLHPDGQMSLQKVSCKLQGPVSVCRLRDFDIYQPTQEALRREIKPPKKFCFAVRSQVGRVLIEPGSDFIHFFCTNDIRIAHSFFAATQRWRSWCLVNSSDGREDSGQQGTALQAGMTAGSNNLEQSRALEGVGTGYLPSAALIWEPTANAPTTRAGAASASGQSDDILAKAPALRDDEGLAGIDRRTASTRQGPSSDKTAVRPKSDKLLQKTKNEYAGPLSQSRHNHTSRRKDSDNHQSTAGIGGSRQLTEPPVNSKPQISGPVPLMNSVGDIFRFKASNRSPGETAELAKSMARASARHTGRSSEGEMARYRSQSSSRTQRIQQTDGAFTEGGLVGAAHAYATAAAQFRAQSEPQFEFTDEDLCRGESVG